MLAFILFTITALFFAYSFGSNARDLAKYSKENKAEVFGKIYNSYFEIYSDFKFHSEIFSGKNIESSTDETVTKRLKELRSDMMFQYLFGALAFISVLITGVTN